MQNAISACAHIQTSAPFTLTCPEGIGRERVRSTLPSKSLSLTSFQVQPAPRMSQAPMPQPAAIQRSCHVAL